MSREVCGICWCPYDKDTGECACAPQSLPAQEPIAWYHVPYPNNGAAPMVSLSKQHEPSMYGAVVPLFLGAPYDQTSLELCEVCGWKTLIPGDCCLNCARINCASLQDQNTELDRKLAEMEAKLNNPSVDDAFRILAEANRRAIDYINQLERQINEYKQTLALRQRSYEREIQIEVEAERQRCADIADAHASIEGIAQKIAAEIRGLE